MTKDTPIRPRDFGQAAKLIVDIASGELEDASAVKGGLSRDWSTTCAANTPTEREVWSCKRDGGRPLGAGDQAQAPNRCELLASRALVVSVAEKAGLDPVR